MVQGSQHCWLLQTAIGWNMAATVGKVREWCVAGEVAVEIVVVCV